VDRSLPPDDILTRVSRPSRYLGKEVNAVFKDPAGIGLRIALAFPDLYDIGTSHFGMQILYHILNGTSDVYAERVFAPADDMAGMLRKNNLPLFSLETGTPLSRFDIIGFSLLYELNYTNILLMLDLAGLPFYASSRDESHPFIIAGGPCTVNPEPVADFFDAMVVGDGESATAEMANAALQWKSDGGRDRDRLLRMWSTIEGVYIPSFFTQYRDDRQRRVLVPRFDHHRRVTRAIVPDLDDAVFPSAPVLPFGKPVHDRLRIEIARGCTRGCRFCQAGMIYRPVRERSLSNLADITDQSIRSTGYDDISLLSLSTGDYSRLAPLMEHIMETCESRRIALSIPSFRAGTLSGRLMEIIRKVRKTGFTIAPEAGTERLRRVINKNVSEEEIIQTTTGAYKLGWNLVKLYFMVGLPTETDADLAGIETLVRAIRKARPGGKRQYNINVSIAQFIPKSHTPFQWVGQEDPDSARDKIEMLRSRLKMPGVGFKWQNPETSFLEGLFARGDRSLSRLLVAAYENGCRFDGWSDSFRPERWREAFDQAGISDPKSWLREKTPGTPLPWDHIDTRISAGYLEAEFGKAISGQETPDCRFGECTGCGVCDFGTIQPVLAPAEEDVPVEPDAEKSGSADPAAPEAYPGKEAPARGPGAHPGSVLGITFSRTGPARFFGHLEQSHIIHRAVQRAGLPVAYSSGFHPKARIVFEDALPVGVESRCEIVYLFLEYPVRPDAAMERLNRFFPAGLEASACELSSRQASKKRPDCYTYRACTDPVRIDSGAIDRFLAAESFPCTSFSRKGGEKTIEMKQAVKHIRIDASGCVEMVLDNSPGTGIRPAVVCKHILGLSPEKIADAAIMKTGRGAAASINHEK